jgi:excisionase family DNA binding protein
MAKRAKEMSVAEAARALGIRLDSTYAALWTGRLQGYKRNGAWRVPVAAVEKYRNRQASRKES